MGTISLDVADLSLDLRALSNSLAHWQALHAAFTGLTGGPSRSGHVLPAHALPPAREHRVGGSVGASGRNQHEAMGKLGLEGKIEQWRGACTMSYEGTHWLWSSQPWDDFENDGNCMTHDLPKDDTCEHCGGCAMVCPLWTWDGRMKTLVTCTHHHTSPPTPSPSRPRAGPCRSLASLLGVPQALPTTQRVHPMTRLTRTDTRSMWLPSGW